jgi:hypothetical protein
METIATRSFNFPIMRMLLLPRLTERTVLNEEEIEKEMTNYKEEKLILDLYMVVHAEKNVKGKCNDFYLLFL